MRAKSLSLVILTWLMACSLHGQVIPCTTLGQNPSSAFPVCGTSTYSQSNVPNCGGNAIPGPCGPGLEDVNPFWYRFTCYVAGTLGFTITPVSMADDYDWQVFDITGRNPNDLYTDASLFVACNWSGFTGVTGATAAGTSLINCAGNVPIFSRMPNLVAGHEYILLVSNYSASQQGYQLNFTGGTAVITDPTAPVLDGIRADCGGQRVTVFFNKKIRCSSLAANGSDFTVSGGGIVSQADGFGCTSGFDMDSASVYFTTPLAPGNYTLTLTTGSDGNTLLDNCGTAIPSGINLPFTVPPRPAMPMGTITPPGCAPSLITIEFPEQIICGSAALDGSDFTITGPSTVTVTGIVPNCASPNASTNFVTLALSGPITVAGNYTLQMANGTDGNTVLGPCNRQVPVGATATFTIVPQTPIAMGTVAVNGCVPTSITLTFAEPIQCSSVAADGSDFTVNGTAIANITSAVPVNCVNGETTTITLNFSAPVTVSGPYVVNMQTGSDGNTLNGQCGRNVPAGQTSGFIIQPQLPIPMGTVPQPPCLPNSITLNFADNILCNSIAPDGSDFVITGPSGVVVTSATAACNPNGETTTISLQLSGSIAVSGAYQVQVVAGSDGNTLNGQCGRTVTAGSNTSFTIQPQLPIPMGTITSTSCSPTSVTINFSTPILCSSNAGDGSDFIVTGPSPVTVISSSPTCNAMAETNSITIQFAAPVAVDGVYQVQVVSGNDGNTLLGQCGRQVNAGDNTTFTIPFAPPVTITGIEPVGCSPNTIRLTLSGPVQCSSIASNGSDFVVNGPSAVTVSGATGSCTNGLTTTIDIQFASPVVTGGNYTVQLVAGSDGNTLLSDCTRPSLPATLSFAASDTVSAQFTYQVQPTCTTSDITFTHPGGNNVNSWNWKVDGTPGVALTTFTYTFPGTGQHTVELTVSNGVCSDTHIENIALNNLVSVDFSFPPDGVCPEDTVRFVNLSQGPVTTWAWDFGNGQTSASQFPPVQQYPQTGTEMTYNVTLTATNSYCQLSRSKSIKVQATCIIAVPSAFSPNNDGRNDFLYPLNAFKADNLDFKVFNRWGQLIFSSANWSRKWDGTLNGIPQASDVYVWTLRYTDRDTRKQHSLRGTVMLVR